MDRRKFIQTMTSAGLGLSMPLFTQTHALTSSPQRFWVSVNASGGWDPTIFIDPKGDRPRADGRGPVNNFSERAISRAGNIPFSSVYPEGVEPPAGDSPGHLANFFAKHHDHLRVINGIDTQTNNHDAGSRFIWSGKIETGYPSFTALVAADAAPSEPLAFISNGGYDFTASLVAPARVGRDDVFHQLAFPNAGRPSAPPEERLPYFIDELYDEVEAARMARLQRLQRRETLPLRHRQLQELFTARSGDNNLHRLVEALPDNPSRGLSGQAEIAVAAFASGVAVSANLSMGGFDTHGNHDQNHYRRLTDLLIGIDHLWEQIELHNLQDKVTVVVGSDFGRTPFYNSNRGKDHWNVTSMMAMGAGVSGNRVIGATDAHFDALPVNPHTLEVDSNGVILTPEHIHVALRQLAGVSSEFSGQFGIQEDALNLFG